MISKTGRVIIHILYWKKLNNKNMKRFKNIHNNKYKHVLYDRWCSCTNRTLTDGKSVSYVYDGNIDLSLPIDSTTYPKEKYMVEVVTP